MPFYRRTRCARATVAIVVVSLVVFVFVFMFLRSRFTGPPHEGLYLLEGKSAVFVGIHRLENFFVSGLKFLQRDGSVTIAIHQSEDKAHGGSVPHHAATTHHASSSHHATAHHAALPHHGVTLGAAHAGAFFADSSATCQNGCKGGEHQNMLFHDIFSLPTTCSRHSPGAHWLQARQP